VEAFAGRYRLIDLIGTGGMGSVWRAWDLRRSAYVAAKVLGQHDAVTLLRFVREQSLRIEHPHLVAPHGWAADDDKVVFAMDLVRGGPVATLLGDHGPLPPSYVAVLLDQLLHGLSAVHAAGVVHRDVKPANLLLDVTGTGRPHLRLSDFGVAGLLDEPRMTRHSTVLGTPGYLAPEQLAGADPDPRQDLYAVGVVAAELLTGERPGADGKVPAVDGPLADFIRRSTASDPSDRPDSATTAGRLLAATGVFPPAGTAPWTADPDSPEVFDQLPPLPPTWTPTGPARHPTPSRPATPRPTPTTEPADPAPAAQATPRSAAQRTPASGQSASAPGGRAFAAGVQAPSTSGVEAVPASGGQPALGSGGQPAPDGGRTALGAGEDVGSDGRAGWVLRWTAGVSFVGAAGLLGAAAWLLLR
jgi:serine/threonine-protein kinase